VATVTRVCISTVTLARTDEEEDALRRALQALSALQFPTYVSDRTSRPGFSDFLTSLAHVNTTEPDGPGLLGQVRASLRAALDSKPGFILYTEPDKEHFFQRGLLEFVDEAADEREVGLIFAARSDESFATFPAMQRYTEGVINQLWEGCGGPSGDYSYGPMLIRPNLVRCLDALDANVGWGWRHFLAGATLASGQRILHRVGHYPCPLDQRHEDDDDRLHRMRQLAENLRGLILSKTSAR
jgi:hypothetical protein